MVRYLLRVFLTALGVTGFIGLVLMAALWPLVGLVAILAASGFVFLLVFVSLVWDLTERLPQ